MPALRLFLLAAAIAGGLAWTYSGEGRTQLAAVDPWFVDFLVANTRNKPAALQRDEVSGDVVLIQFDESQKAEYSAWPPAPLDYIMVLKRLAPHEPDVVAFAESLKWDGETPEFVLPLRQALVSQTSVVFGFEVSNTAPSSPDPEFQTFLESELPAFGSSEDSIEAMPGFTHIAALPAKSLRVVGQMGIASFGAEANAQDKVPLLARYDNRIIPTVAAQAVTLYRRTPYAAMRLRLGAGARLSLGDRYIIPLDRTGSVRLLPDIAIPVVNALELLTPELGMPSEKLTKEALGKKKIIILSHTQAGLREAHTIASTLSAPAFHQATPPWEWGVAGAVALLAFWQSRYRRFGVLAFGFGVLVAGMGISLLVFQTSLAWCSPLPTLAVITCSTLFCFIWPGARQPRPKKPAPRLVDF